MGGNHGLRLRRVITNMHTFARHTRRVGADVLSGVLACGRCGVRADEARESTVCALKEEGLAFIYSMTVAARLLEGKGAAY